MSDALVRAEALLAADAENVQSASWWFAEARGCARDVIALSADLAAARAREQRALKLCERPIFEVEEQGLHVAATGNAYGLAKAVRAALAAEPAADEPGERE